MARLRKEELLGLVEQSLLDGGWRYLCLDDAPLPRRYLLFKGESQVRASVYIWNITHGGNHRSADEYRIQITGTSRFTRETGGGKVVILGWWGEQGVFAAYDYRQHSGILGGSPSFQVRRNALEAAATAGVDIFRKDNEVVVTFRPELLGYYIENLESIHDFGVNPAFLATLVSREEPQTEGLGAEPRQEVIVETRKLLRESDFRKRVLEAYGHACAFCGLQMNLVDGSHILPVAHPDSTDHTSNGIALCALHHRAYDHGLVTFFSNYAIRISAAAGARLEGSGLSGGFAFFRESLRPEIVVPFKASDRPGRSFIALANQVRGWG